MTDLTITDWKFSTTRKVRMYSSIVWKNLLKRVLDYFGIEILFQFWFNTNIVDRMVKKWLLGGEVDILTAIWKNREQLKVKYLRRREFEILRSTLSRYIAVGYLKPICMLSLFRTWSKTKHLKLFSMSYEELMFGKSYRWLLDRHNFYDAFIYFICELYEHQQKLTSQQFETLLNTDYASLVDSTSPAWQRFGYFSYFYLGQAKKIECKIQRKPGLSMLIETLYKEIRAKYLEQWIADIKLYCCQMSWWRKRIYHNMHYVNFVLHNRRRHFNTTIPNILLQWLRSLSAKLSKETNLTQVNNI